MITNFVNRNEELEFLEKKYKEKSAQHIIIYGRRRVGKTELVKKFFCGKEHVYFLSSNIAINEQVGQFITSSYEALGDETLLDLKPNFETVFKYIAGIKKRLIVVIDEFPYLIDADKTIVSLFQRIWDLYLNKSNIFLILLGSSIGMMENEVLGYKSPLYGRRTGQWKVEAMHFKDLSSFFPNYSVEERIRTYSILGGIPFYLQQFDDGSDVSTNIKEKILTKGEILYEEPEFLLREELREPRVYFTILKAISYGNSKFGNIMNVSGLNKNTLTRYLDILGKLHIIRRELPITEKNPEKSKKGLYKIADPFFRFWFRFVLPNVSKIEEDVERAFDEKIRLFLDQYYVSFSFEDVCKEVLLELSKQNRLPMRFSRIGSWWHRNNEIDIVALNEDTKEILFAECKWQNKKVGIKVYDELIEKSKLVNWNNEERKEYFALFSKAGFTPQLRNENVLLFDLHDIDDAS
jgi:AAA+ ATPase superfamily predicted ATPase